MRGFSAMMKRNLKKHELGFYNIFFIIFHKFVLVNFSMKNRLGDRSKNSNDELCIGINIKNWMIPTQIIKISRVKKLNFMEIIHYKNYL